MKTIEAPIPKWQIILALMAISVAITLSSCSPTKRLENIYDRNPELLPDSSTNTSYIERIEFDTIMVHTPADTIALIIAADCPDLEAEVKTPGGDVTVTIKDKVLTAEVICNEDSLEMVIWELQTELTSEKTIIQEVEVEVPVKYTPKFWIYGTIGCFILIILILLYILYRVKTKGFKMALKGIVGG